jgi:ATP-binding cassette subfamily B protein
MKKNGLKVRVLASEARAHLALLARTWKLVWSAGQNWTLGWIILLVTMGVLPMATIYGTKGLVDHLVTATRANGSWATTKPVLYWALFLVGISLLSEVIQSGIEWVRTHQSELLRDHISSLIHRKSTEVDLAFYESPEYYDRLYRARDEANTKPVGLVEHAGGLVQNSITLLILAGIAASYGPGLLIAILAAMLPAVYVVVRYNWLSHEWWKQTTVERRWIQYYDEKFASPAAAPEIRLFGLLGRFNGAYCQLRKGLRRQHLRLIEKQSIARLLASLGGLGIAGGSIGWMGWRALHGSATLGDLVLFYQVFAGGQSLVRGVTGSAGQVYSHTLFIANLFHFLDLKSDIADPLMPVAPPEQIRDGIRLESVSFSYPGSDRPALHDFNLYLPANRITAVVGPNGAGKSTLIKLLSRFYDPDSGSIKIDGIDLRKLKVADLRALLTILFQVPVRYDASARENIALGFNDARSSDASIRAAARAAGIDSVITGLQNGYDTLLGKSFEHGAELSAGEWQRVAMARALLRPSPLVLMDEPTSAMDSWAEADWFERIRAMTKGRTVLLITHRFTIAKRADLIHVMQTGEIVESGTHHDLLALEGLYASSWREQIYASLPDENPVGFGPIAAV